MGTPAPGRGDTSAICERTLPEGALFREAGDVPFQRLAVTVEFEAVGAVGELRVADAEGGVGADGALRGGEGLFAVGIMEEERALLPGRGCEGRRRSDRGRRSGHFPKDDVGRGGRVFRRRGHSRRRCRG